MTSDRTSGLLYYGATLGGYALLGVALVLAVVIAMKRGRDEAPASPEHVTWIADTLDAAAADRRRKLPPPMQAFVRDYLKDARVLICPSAALEFSAGYWPVRDRPDARDRSYCYVQGLSQKDAHDYILCFDEEWNHAVGPKNQGVNVLYVGGHVEWRSDLDELQLEAVSQLLEMHGRMRGRGPDELLQRPWWSRYPEPPAFDVPPPKREDDGALMGASVLSLAVAAAAALVGVYVLRRIVR
jgi:prepilin-type processing-associated H-X9-DG protein